MHRYDARVLTDFALNLTAPLAKQHLSGDLLEQVEAIKQNKPLMIVGTPGRLAELSRAGALLSHTCPLLVLDEASHSPCFAMRIPCPQILHTSQESLHAF